MRKGWVKNRMPAFRHGAAPAAVPAARGSWGPRAAPPAFKSCKAARRLRRNVRYLQQQDSWAQQQERALDGEEELLLKKQVWVTGLRSTATAAELTSEFSKYGSVLQLQLQRSHGSGKNALTSAINLISASLMNISLQSAYCSGFSGSNGEQKPPPLLRAVVEFTDAAGAAAALAARRTVPIFRRNEHGARSSKEQLVLPAAGIGYLREPCTCRKYRIQCACPGYVKVVPHRPPRHQSYHRGGAGLHRLSAVQLQLGSPGPDGCTPITELDMHTMCSVTIDLQQRCLTLEAPFDTPNGPQQHLLVIDFRHLRRSLLLNSSDCTMTFTVRQPPKVLRKVPESPAAAMFGMDDGPDWELAMDPTAAATGAAGAAEAGDAAVGRGLAGAHGVLGRCTWYRVRLAAAAMEGALAVEGKLWKKLRSFKLLAGQARQPGTTAPTSRQQWEQRHGACGLPGMLQQLDFGVGYHVQLLLSSGAASMWQASSPDVQQLLLQQSPRAAAQALAELAGSAVPIRDMARALQQQLEGLEAGTAGQAAAPSPERCSVLRVHVTTTRVKYLRPEQESGNRVIRHFSSPAASRQEPWSFLHDLRCLSGLVISNSHFLRVSFGDEHGDRLFDSRQEPVEEFYTLMRNVLQHGLWVNSRYFSFLAYSSSQLKTWSCWFVADPLQGQRGAAGAEALAAALRYWMGDAMDTEKVPAKCAARLGQCFSTTVDAAEVPQHQSARLADVERNSYCFSDGVGVISPLLLEEVVAVLPFAPRGAPISAIQIRYGGAKGVLSRFSALRGRQLQLRPSQLKFGSSHPQLEVCSVAAWLPAYLNRQVIIMMAHNGVPDQAFMGKLESCLNDLAAMCSSPQDARRVLPLLGGIEPGAQSTMLSMLAVAAACGLPLDPLLDSCLKAVARWQVTDLRAKARLLVQQGATLVGVMDEYGVLEEGQVFVQVQSRTMTQPKVIMGPVVLAKSPVSHIGDVRRVEAVAPLGMAGQQLAADYVNVVVFSQKGQRPLPNMLSGSDLDGDQYLVLWDQQLLQPINSPAQDYTAEKPAQVDHVTAEDLQKHFVNFARNDNLGQISTWLLAQADARGPASPECKQLAALHSTAVDFPKTGKPAELDFKLLPEQYPHFMERKDKQSYESSTVLGQMYDRVLAHPLIKKLLEADAAANLATNNATNSSNEAQTHQLLHWPEQLLQAPGLGSSWRELLSDAEQHFAASERELVALMNHWAVYDVGEMLTGCVRRLQRRKGQHHQSSQQRDQLQHEVREVFGGARRRYLVRVLQLLDAAAGRDPAAAAAAGAAAVQRSLEGSGSYEGMTLRALEAAVVDRAGGAAGDGGVDVADGVRLPLAAAYLVAAHKWLLKQQQLAGAPAASGRCHGMTAAGLLLDDDSSAEDSSDGGEDDTWGDWQPEDTGNQQQQQQQQLGWAKGQEVSPLVRLCFQWVVHKELAELSDAS